MILKKIIKNIFNPKKEDTPSFDFAKEQDNKENIPQEFDFIPEREKEEWHQFLHDNNNEKINIKRIRIDYLSKYTTGRLLLNPKNKKYVETGYPNPDAEPPINKTRIHEDKNNLVFDYFDLDPYYKEDQRLTADHMEEERIKALNTHIYLFLKELFTNKDAEQQISERYLQFKNVVIRFINRGMDTKGNDVDVEFARVIINTKKWSELNLTNIFSKGRWDILLNYMNYNFAGFPDGAKGYKGNYGKMYEVPEKDVDLDWQCSKCKELFTVTLEGSNLQNCRRGYGLNVDCPSCNTTNQVYFKNEKQKRTTL